MTNTITISGLFTYPIKSAGGISHDTLTLTNTGLEYDRHWVITDADGVFLTQRDVPQMALIQPRFEGDTLVISAPGMDDLRVPIVMPADAPCERINVWRDAVEAAFVGAEAAKWVSGFLKQDAKLFAKSERTVRHVASDWTDLTPDISFADGFPLLVVSEASLDELNRRLRERGKQEVPMRRFRPNIVVTGNDEPFAEDTWRTFTVSGIPFQVSKPCARCPVTTVDPQTGVIPDPKEPLATLATFRKEAHGVTFGQNTIHLSEGTLRVGDPLQF